jgi:hypothetical protein
MQIIHELIEAHGGMERWSGLEALDAEMSVRGFLFTAKRRHLLDHVRVKAEAHEPRFSFFDFPKEGQTAEWIGNDEVRILDSSGAVLSRRENPRHSFKGLRRQFWWDDLDFIYFAAYATWNYLTFPFLFTYKGFLFEALEPLQGKLSRITRLQVTFPDDIPTHSRKQVFYIDDQRMLRRLDYTAEVVGRWAHAAHLCENYRTFDGIKAPTHRKVLPFFVGRTPLPGPVLVEIDMHDIRPVPAAPSLVRAA